MTNVKFLSQTFIDENGHNHNQRMPANISAFKNLIVDIKKTNSNIQYYVNPTVHSKFIVIDDWAFISSCNFTPTEFIYIPNVEIKHFENIERLTYCGTFSEVGHYVAIKSEELSKSLIVLFNDVVTCPNTYKHNL